MSEVRVILIFPDGREVEVDPAQCGPTVRLALRELVREAVETFRIGAADENSLRN